LTSYNLLCNNITGSSIPNSEGIERYLGLHRHSLLILLELQLSWLLGNLRGEPEVRIVVSNSTELLTHYTKLCIYRGLTSYCIDHLQAIHYSAAHTITTLFQ
jgi:hypothetical protein